MNVNLRSSAGPFRAFTEAKAEFRRHPFCPRPHRAGLFYLQAGYPIHLSGPAGTGKTTLAMHMAAQLRRPVALIHGDDEYGSSDLVGGQLGYRSDQGGRQLHSLRGEDARRTSPRPGSTTA